MPASIIDRPVSSGKVRNPARPHPRCHDRDVRTAPPAPVEGVAMDRFSVATFNLYNLQLPGRGMNPGQPAWTDDEYRRKLDWTGRQLKELDADIVGLQELWHADAMAEALDRANLDDDYDLLATPATGGSITCAALVRTGLLRGDADVDRDVPGHASPRVDVRRSAGPGHPRAPRRLRPAGAHVRRRPARAAAARPRCTSPTSSRSCPTRIDQEPWYDAELDRSPQPPHGDRCGPLDDPAHRRGRRRCGCCSPT